MAYEKSMANVMRAAAVTRHAGLFLLDSVSCFF